MPSDSSDTPLYNIAAVVQRTGVPATTIRAWERRYDYPKPHRDEGGRRLYSEHDVQTIRWLLDQTRHGVAISRAVDMLRSGHARTDSAVVQAPARGGRSFAALRADLGQALLDLDADRADVVLAEAFTLFSVEDVCLQVLQPLLVDIGDRWHAGELSVAEEHYATSFVRARLFGLLQAYQPPHKPRATGVHRLRSRRMARGGHLDRLRVPGAARGQRPLSRAKLATGRSGGDCRAPSPGRRRSVGPESRRRRANCAGQRGRCRKARHRIHGWSSVARRSTRTPGCAPASTERMSVQTRRPPLTLSRDWSNSRQRSLGDGFALESFALSEGRAYADARGLRTVDSIPASCGRSNAGSPKRSQTVQPPPGRGEYHSPTGTIGTCTPARLARTRKPRVERPETRPASFCACPPDQSSDSPPGTPAAADPRATLAGSGDSRRD